MKVLNSEIEQRFSDWQRGLATRGKRIPPAVAERQKELRQVVYEGPIAFANYMRDQLGVRPDSFIDAPALPGAVGAVEYRDPPFPLERSLCKSWDGLIHRSEASRPAFWTLAHIKWLEDGQLGDQITDTFLRGGGRDSTEDQRIRNLLRRIGGLPHVRGKVSVLSDSPISRAWWRGNIASEISNAAADDLAFEAVDVHRVLHSHNDAWARLVGDSVHRITVMNQPRARAVIVKLYEGASRENRPIPPQEMQLVARLISRHSVSLAFEHIDWDELTEIALEALERVRAEMGGAGRSKVPALNEQLSAGSIETDAPFPEKPNKRKSLWGSLSPFSRS